MSALVICSYFFTKLTISAGQIMTAFAHTIGLIFHFFKIYFAFTLPAMWAPIYFFFIYFAFTLSSLRAPIYLKKFNLLLHYLPLRVPIYPLNCGTFTIGGFMLKKMTWILQES